MSNNFKVLGGVVLVAVLGVAGWFLVTKQSQENMETKNENQQEEKQVVKEDGQKQGEEKVEKLKIEDMDTSNWKTYRNEEFGFEVNHPKGWQIFDDGELYNGTHLLYIYPKNRSMKSACSLYVRDNGNNLSIEQIIDNELKYYPVRGGVGGLGIFQEYEYEEFIIGSKKGRLYNIDIDDEQTKGYVFVSGEIFFVLGGTTDCHIIAPQLVKTIK